MGAAWPAPLPAVPAGRATLSSTPRSRLATAGPPAPPPSPPPRVGFSHESQRRRWGRGVGWGSVRRWTPAHQIRRFPTRCRGGGGGAGLARLRALPGGLRYEGLSPSPHPPSPLPGCLLRPAEPLCHEGFGKAGSGRFVVALDLGGSAHSMPGEQLTRLGRWPGGFGQRRPPAPPRGWVALREGGGSPAGVTPRASPPKVGEQRPCRPRVRGMPAAPPVGPATRRQRGCPAVLPALPGGGGGGVPSPMSPVAPALQGQTGDPGQPRRELLTWAGSILAKLQGRF